MSVGVLWRTECLGAGECEAEVWVPFFFIILIFNETAR